MSNNTVSNTSQVLPLVSTQVLNGLCRDHGTTSLSSSKAQQVARQCFANASVKAETAAAQSLSSRVSVPQPFEKDFSHAVNACKFTDKNGAPIAREEAFQAGVTAIKKVKQQGGTVYVVASGKDQSASHFTTDLMKGLGTSAQTVTYNSPELEFLKPEDLVVFADYSPELVPECLQTRSDTSPQMITLSEGRDPHSTHFGDVNFSIEQAINPVVGKMMRMYILHTMIDLCQLPQANVEDRTLELHSSVTDCIHTDRNGNRMTTAESTAISHELIERVRAQKGTVYVVGNGGSDQIASDTKDQLLKKGVLSKVLTSNSCLTTCLSNDYGFEHVFSDQLKKSLKPQDLVIAISSSGGSKNILNAVETAHEKNVPVITLSGFKAENPLRKTGDVNLYIDKKDYGLVEVGHFYLLYNLLDSMSSQLPERLLNRSSRL